MEFTECEVSGQLKAEGCMGQYWIDEQKNVELTRVTSSPAGPRSVMLARCKTVEEAKEIAERLDKAEL